MSVQVPVITAVSPLSPGQTSITNASVLTLGGTAAANTTVQVYDSGVLIGTAAVNASGVWSFSTSTLPDGWHSFTAVDKDGSGATSASSAAFGLGVDTHAPSTPTITGFSPDTGNVGDAITTASVVTLSGTGEANTT